MKKIFTLVFAVFAITAKAQITIDNGDMPNTGDTLRMSVAPLTTIVDVTLTGANYNWDFSTLVPDTQVVDSFVTLASTGLTFGLYFAFAAHVPNIVEHVSAIGAFTGVPIGNPMRFNRKQTSNYATVGYGGNLQGTDVPLGFNNPDVIYNFPLNFADQDSSDSDFTISVPGTGYAEGFQHRVNNVDGWGSLITPYGTFNVLRIVSKTTGHDSIYDAAAGQGYSIDPPVTREYKWLGKNQGVPLLQITTQEVLGNEVVTDIQYRDSTRNEVTTGIQTISKNQTTMELLGNPSTGIAALRYSSLTADPVLIRIYDLTGKEVRHIPSISKPGINICKLDMDNAVPGIYMVSMVQNGKTVKSLRWVISN